MTFFIPATQCMAPAKLFFPRLEPGGTFETTQSLVYQGQTFTCLGIRHFLTLVPSFVISTFLVF